ncbi:SMI1/KNR4 family protein [Streptomyces brevispora]|uniref:SMI1/KNR4 family protein n=1 Tax=Streptomyces brevispora TaxID=887462 RepID=UPI002E331C57|nr:SMI1/KNR4 family protein [Streptomyces brevispora]
MSADLVQDSWTRIDAWLREHAPRTFATLRPPAGDKEIAAAQEELGVTFPPDLIASLLRHDGALEGPEAFRFSTGDRLLGLSGILGDTGFMRGIDQGLDGEAEGYWLHGYVKFGSYDVTSDGLLMDCRTGRDSFGAIGRFFDETGTSFGQADSLGGCLAELAGKLERGQDAGVVTFNGRLFWEGPLPARPECGADEPLPAPDEQLPELDLSHSPTDLLHVSYLDGHEELGALIAVLPYEQVVEAARKQLRRLAVDTGLNNYPEVKAALDAWERGSTPPRPDRTDPLALRLRAVLAQADAGRDHTRRWAAEKMALGIWGSPYRSVCESAYLRSHFTLDWRADLHADLGNPPLPPIPDDRFWGTLSNPAIDSSWYAAQYTQDQD